MRAAALFVIVLVLAVPAAAQEGFTLGLADMPLPVEAQTVEPTVDASPGGIDLDIADTTREELVYWSAITPRTEKEFTLALWNAPMGRLYYSRAEAESMLGREGLVHGGRMVGLGLATGTIGDQGQSTLGFLAHGGTWSELTLGEKFAAGAEASFLAAILYALASYAD